MNADRVMTPRGTHTQADTKWQRHAHNQNNMASISTWHTKNPQSVGKCTCERKRERKRGGKRERERKRQKERERKTKRRITLLDVFEVERNIASCRDLHVPSIYQLSAQVHATPRVAHRPRRKRLLA